MSAQEPPLSTSSPGLVADLICRTVLAVLANIAIWVPFRLLWKNGELAAALLCGVVMLMNTLYFINALIWRDDDIDSWWDGTGWCDLQAYILVPLRTLYSACIMAIMRHLSQQLNLARASALTQAEKRRRNLIQALIVFPLPLLQIALTYLVLQNRYVIMALHGCEPFLVPNGLSLAFFFLAQPLFCVGALFYAVLAYKRFRDIKKTTQAAHSGNTSVASRANRTKRKLYGMTMSILIPFTPIVMIFLFRNIRAGEVWSEPYDFSKIHDNPMWNKVVFITSDQTGFPRLQINYISILTAVPIFLFFGTTKDSLNIWRRLLLALGLGRVFPGLKEEYDPDRPKKGSGGSGNTGGKLHSLKSWGSSPLSPKNTNKACLPNHHEQHPIATISPANQDSISQVASAVPPSASKAATHSQLPIVSHDEDEIRLPQRVPWLFRTTLVTPLKVPPFAFPKLGGGRRKDEKPSSRPATGMADIAPCQTRSESLSRITAPAGGGGNAQDDDDQLPQQRQQQHHWPARREQSPRGSPVETCLWPNESPPRPPPPAAAVAPCSKCGAEWDEETDPNHPGVRVKTNIATPSFHQCSTGSPNEEAMVGDQRKGWGV